MKRWKRDGSPWVIHYNGRSVTSVKRTWRLACRAAGLVAVSPHTLRHTRATWLMQAGVDPWEAAGHLGMSLEMLVKNYAKHSPDFQKKASEV